MISGTGIVLLKRPFAVSISIPVYLKYKSEPALAITATASTVFFVFPGVLAITIPKK